jgi:thiamine biosynthesis lipoprotein
MTSCLTILVANVRLAWFIAPMLLPALVACDGQRTNLTTHELSGQTMGTTFNIKVAAPDDEQNIRPLQQRVTDVLSRVNQRMSTWMPDSELSKFNDSESTDWVGVSAEFCGVIEAALGVSEFTGGAFDITVGPLVNLWGFGPGDGNRHAPPDDESIAATRQRVGYRQVQASCDRPAVRKARPDVYIDLSAYAKGYAVDQLACLLDELGLANYLVEVGGELRLSGRSASGDKWAIAVEKPADFERTVQTIVHLTDRAMATSGDYRNFFQYEGQRFSHTIDTRTGRPVTHAAAAVTVVSETAALADALATALLVLGPDEGFEFAERQQIAAVFLLRNDEQIEERVTTMFASMQLQ